MNLCSDGVWAIGVLCEKKHSAKTKLILNMCTDFITSMLLVCGAAALGSVIQTRIGKLNALIGTKANAHHAWLE